ncbi:MAG: hypothetical protein Q8N81_00015, partial [bacterium]|nr:hypothetical protein [bacterium]
FGGEFWSVYFGSHILRRALYGMSDKTTATSTYYLKLLWSYYQPWILLLPAACAYAIVFFRSQLRHRPLIISSILAALCILLTFTYARTQLFPYIIPFYPLAAIFLAVVFHDITIRFQEAKTTLYVTGAIMLTVGALMGFGAIGTFTADAVRPYNYEEKNLSVLVQKENSDHAPIYVLQWSHVKTIEYYTGQIVKTSKGDGLFTSPFYLIAPKQIMEGLFDARGDLLPQLGQIRKVYEGDKLVVLYSEQDLQLAPTGEKTFIPD